MYFTFATYYKNIKYVPVVYKNDKLFIQNHLYANETIETYKNLDINKILKNKRPIFIKDIFLYSKRWDFNWRHFLIETFYTIYKYLNEKEKNPELKLVIMNDSSRWIYEILEILNITDYVCLKKDTLIISDNVIIKKNVYNQEFMDLFISKCKEKSIMVDCESRRKLYISRINVDKNKKRELINNDQFYNFYVKGKLYEIFPEELKLWDQVSLINNATMILNLIGANCDNIIFANKECKFHIIYSSHCKVWAKWYLKNNFNITPILHEHGSAVGKSTDGDPYNRPWKIHVFKNAIFRFS